MSFFEFPHTRTYDNDLGWLIKHVWEVVHEMEIFVNLNEIKFADPIQWSIARQYEKSTVVVDPWDGTAYLSTQPVPAGVSLMDENYWTPIFNYGEIVDTLRHQITDTVTDPESDRASIYIPQYAMLWWRSELYMALQDIQIGDTLEPGVNIESITLEEWMDSAAASKMQTFDTVAEMRACETIPAGAVVRTLGYYAKGDGGGAQYLTSASGTDNGYTVIETAGGTFASLIVTGFMTARQFGAVGDNVANDTAALRIAMNTADVLDLQGLTYKVTGFIDVNAKEYSDIRNGTLDASLITSTSEILRFAGSLFYETTGYTIDGDTLQLPSTWGLEPGVKYIALINSSEISVQSYTRGVYLPTVGTFVEGRVVQPVNNGRVRIFKPQRVNLTNLNIIGINRKNVGLVLWHCTGNVRNCTIQSYGGRWGIGATGVDLVVDGCEVSGFLDLDLVDNRTGYGVSMVGNNITVQNCSIYNCKHCISGANSPEFWCEALFARNNRITQNTAFIHAMIGNEDPLVWNNAYWMAIDCHALAVNVVIENNEILSVGSQPNVAVWGTIAIGRCRAIEVLNNKFATNDPTLRLTPIREQRMDYLVFSGNTASDNFHWRFDWTDDYDILNFVAENNNIKGLDIYMKGGSGSFYRIINNNLERCVIARGGAAASVQISNNFFYNTSTPTTTSIELNDCAQVLIVGNLIQKNGLGTYAMYIGGTSYGLVISNLFMFTSGGSLYVSSTSVTVKGNYNQLHQEIGSNI